MRTFTEPMKGLREICDLEEALPKLAGVIQVSGCIDAAKPHIMHSIHNGSGNRIIVTFHEQKARELWEEYRFFDKKAAYYPAKDILFYQSDIRGNVLTAERINALKLIAEEKECTVITTFDGLMNPMPVPKSLSRQCGKSLWVIPLNWRSLQGISRNSATRRIIRRRRRGTSPCAAASSIFFR